MIHKLKEEFIMSDRITKSLASFATGVTYETLSKPVIAEVKEESLIH